MKLHLNLHREHLDVGGETQAKCETLPDAFVVWMDPELVASNQAGAGRAGAVTGRSAGKRVELRTHANELLHFFPGDSPPWRRSKRRGFRRVHTLVSHRAQSSLSSSLCSPPSGS